MPEDTSVVATPQITADGAPLGAGGGQMEAPPEQPQQQQRAEPRNVTVPTDAMRRIKEEQYQKGQQAALDALARQAGYSNNEELVAALRAARGQGQQAQVQQRQAAPQYQQQEQQPQEEDPAQDLAQAKASRREEGKFQRQMEKVLTERNKYAQTAQAWQKKAQEAQAEADAVRAEMHLRTIAASAGVQDIDYAITLFSREVERLTPEEAATFDEKVYFDGLRKTKPLLFGEAVLPATTGTGMGGAPMPPKPGAVAAQNAQNGRVDARKLDPRAYAAELAKRGINP
jgi:hypothetical protein